MNEQERERGSGERATPPIGDEDQEPGQTSHPAPEEDVGVPPDEEMEEGPGGDEPGEG
jgi:hypothetical protein